MKRHFITGLVILLPLALTLVVITFIFNLLTDPFLGVTQSIFSYFNLFDTGFGIFTATQVQQYAAKFSIVIFLLAFTILLGALARWFIFHYLLRLWDFFLHRIPFVSTIYKTSQDVISTIFGNSTNSFKQVVMVPFPNAGSRSMGFVTRDDLPSFQKDQPGQLVAVFMPTTPNPTSGFLMLFPESDVTYIDMRVEDAFKYIVSCGVIATPIIVTERKKTLITPESEDNSSVIV